MSTSQKTRTGYFMDRGDVGYTEIGESLMEMHLLIEWE